jgi:hypothetical protein
MNLTNMETGRKEEITGKTAEEKESRKIEKWQKYKGGKS